MQDSLTRPVGAALYDAATFDPDTAVSYLLHLSVHSIKSQVEQSMVLHDLTAMQWQPLYMIAIGRANTAAELARLMQVDTGAVTRMIDRLEAKDLVQRERSTADRRVVHLALTDVGRACTDAVPTVLCDVLNNHLRDFDKEELQLLMSLLKRMIANGAEVSNG